MKTLFLFFKKVFLGLLEERWELGISSFSESDFGLNSITWIENPFNDRWFADPFILNETDSIIEVLVEEWKYTEKRGCISKVTIDKTSKKIVKAVRILVLDTHLSFPNIIREGGRIFFYPENTEAGELALYEYFPETSIVEKRQVLLNIPIADAALFKLNGKWFMTGTRPPNDNGNVLSVFVAENWNGVYTHTEDIRMTDCSARGGGGILKCGKRLIRVSQDCTGGYGRGLVFSEISFDGKGLRFKELSRFYLPEGRVTGCHTYNTYGNVVIVDRKKYRYPIIGRFSRLLLSAFLKRR